MMRWDILNAFIEKYNYKSFLEIGYYKGWSFDQVGMKEGEPILNKIAVDPDPCKNTEMEKMPYGMWYTYPKGYNQSAPYEGVLKQTSDDFFSKLTSEEIKYDIIFIDGLHKADQVTKDIYNALDHLSPGGTIVLHDCNPPKYEHTTTGIDGCWTGDTYKAFTKFKLQHPEYEAYTIDTDWGCGVIHTPPRDGTWIDMTIEDMIHNWEYFNENRKRLLNLVSVDEFKTKLNEGTKDNFRATQ